MVIAWTSAVLINIDDILWLVLLVGTCHLGLLVELDGCFEILGIGSRLIACSC